MGSLLPSLGRIPVFAFILGACARSPHAARAVHAPTERTRLVVLGTGTPVADPDLILGPAVLHRRAPLVAYGSRGLRDMTTHILAAWKKDIDVRVNGLEHGDADAYSVDVHEVDPGVVYRDGRVTVSVFLVKHGSWDEALGYRFETPDRTIVISGDTAPCDEVVRACNGCDILVHEVYSQTGFETLDATDRRYHSAFHTSAPELARIATAARPGQLVLYHQLFFGSSESALVDEVRVGYPGVVVSAHDLQVF